MKKNKIISNFDKIEKGSIDNRGNFEIVDIIDYNLYMSNESKYKKFF